MKARLNRTRFISIVAVLLMTVSSVLVFPVTGTAGRAPGLDIAPTGFPTHKDIDETGTITYPQGQTAVQASIRNVGDTAATNVEARMDIGTGVPVNKLSADAESGALPAGWSKYDFTNNRWHIVNDTFASATHSVWCGGTGAAGIQYGMNWEESLRSNNIIIPGATTPILTFNQRYNTPLNSDGGFVEIQDTSVGAWENNNTANWTFISGGYNAKTGPNNPISKDIYCWGGPDSFWQTVNIDLTKYIGKTIQIRFVFSSSNGATGGWHIDDVRVYSGVTTIFSDNFEGTMGNWNNDNLRNPGGVGTSWGIYNETAQSYNLSSQKCFSNRETGTNAYLDREDSALVTSTVALTGITHARLNFYTKIQSQAGNDGGFVEMQIGSGGQWTELMPYRVNYPSSLDGTSCYGNVPGYSNANMGWNRTAFDLTPFVGSTIRLRFHFFANDDGNVNTGWYLDEITITGWNFVQSATDKKVVGNLAVGETQTASFSFPLDNEGYYLLKATSLVSGEPGANLANNVTHIIIFVKNILTLGMTLSASSLQITHGKKGELGINVTNPDPGNMANDVDLRVVSAPGGWNLTLNRSLSISVPVGGRAAVKLDLGVPLDTQAIDFGPIRINATSRLNSKSVEQSFTVSVQNNPPLSVAGARKNGKVYSAVQFDGSGSSDPDGDVLNYTWDFGDGQTAAGVRPSHTYTVASTYIVRLNVTDGCPGYWNVSSLDAVIADDLPEALFTIDTPDSNGSYEKKTDITFNASKSRDENTTLLTYLWDFGDLQTGNGLIVTHNYTAGGAYNVSLNVTDAGGQWALSAPVKIQVNNPPVANISSPGDRASFHTIDDIMFSSNGTYDPDLDPVYFEWTSNLIPGQVLSTAALFSRKINVTGTHTITLRVTDKKGLSSWGSGSVMIYISERINIAPKLSLPAVTPAEGDEGTVFRFSVKYTDDNNDRPQFIHLVVDGQFASAQTMIASDPQDNNFTDGKDYYFLAGSTILKGDVFPHNYTFETADSFGSAKVTTDVLTGPLVKWYRPIGKDSWMPDVVKGTVYQTGNYRTILSGVDTTPPDKPATKESIGVSFVMNTTAPADKWYWVNLTVIYTTLNYSRINQSTLQVFWSIDGGAWAPVPVQGIEKDSQRLWFNVSRSSAKFAVFGTPLPPPPPPPPPPKPAVDNTMLYIGGGAAAGIAVAAVAGIMVMRRRKSKAPPEPTYTPDTSSITPVGKTDAKTKFEATDGEEVKVFRPGGDSGKFKPGQTEEEPDVKVFKPGGADEEAETKVFRPGGKETVQDETITEPVVQEDAREPAVVDYPANEQAPAHEVQPVREEGPAPGSDAAQEPVSPDESEAPKAAEPAHEPPNMPEAPKAPEEAPEPPKSPEKKPASDLDSLLDELNK